MEKSHIDWSRNLFSVIKDGGAWAVPRSGLIFRKEGNGLVLVNPQPLNGDQESDYDAIKAHFEAAGIGVRK